jgi:DNA-binding CsgD family transcriptional regulator
VQAAVAGGRQGKGVEGQGILVRLSKSERHSDLLRHLDRASLDPAAWADACDALARLVDATGTVLIPYDADDRGPALPRSPSLEDGMQRYLDGGWHKHDLRADKGFPRALNTGYATDQDVIAPEEMRRHPYYQEFLRPLGLCWFAAISFEVGGKVWAASVQGTPARGPFLTEDVAALLKVRTAVELAARRAAALGNRRVEFLEDAFAGAERGVAALDSAGRITRLDARAERMLREAELARHGRLGSRDTLVHRRLSDLVDGAVAFRWASGLKLPGPVLVPGAGGKAFSVDAIPMPRDFQALLAGATVLVTIHEVAASDRARPAFRERWRLTAREAELAQRLAAGDGLADAAAAMGISLSTARQHLKAVFEKTHTHRQGELVALIARQPG